jgi:hypothetical protein
MSFVEQVLIHEPFVEQADRVEELHQMRIAAKHLRYALEIVAPLFEGRLAAPVEVSRSLQRQLGEIHDCDVWIDFLPRFIRGERRRTRKFFGHTRGFRRISQGLEELLASRRAHRAELHDAFVDYWHRSCGGQFWLDLRTVLADGPSGGAGVPSPSGRDRAPTATRLLEGVPGLGKTLLIRALGRALDLSFSRVQFTPDLMPADITGTEIMEERDDGRRGFRFQRGPVFANLVLADEINRATPKTQSALLEAMQERTVTVANTTYPAASALLRGHAEPLATQNPRSTAQEGHLSSAARRNSTASCSRRDRNIVETLPPLVS